MQWISPASAGAKDSHGAYPRSKNHKRNGKFLNPFWFSPPNVHPILPSPILTPMPLDSVHERGSRIDHDKKNPPTLLVVESSGPITPTEISCDKEAQGAFALDVDSEDAVEGGAKGILTVIGAFFALFSTFGLLNTFGTFQLWYASHQLSAYSPSTISWIGSLQLWLFFFSVRQTICHHG